MQAARLEPPIAAADTGRIAVHLALRALTGLSMSLVLGVLFDHAGPASADRAPSIDVSRTGALIGDPFDLRVTGLAPQSTAEIVASTTSSGVVWQSVATCKADKSGTIDLKTCDSTAGAYTGVDAGGLLWSMRPQSGNATSYLPPDGDQAIDYTIEVRISGTVRATARFSRLRVKPDVVVRTMTAPFHGTVASPPDQKRRPAVILLGGSEGGDSMAAFAKLLASHGYVAASVAYFGLPGLPKHLVDVPIETVGQTAIWLSEQADVDPNRIAVIGLSKGAELALLAASTYPQLRAVVSIVGSPRAMYGVDPTAVSPNGKGSWTKGGVEIPYVHPDPTTAVQVRAGITGGEKVRFALEADASIAKDRVAAKQAFFPLENITGPVLCIGSGDDGVWNSAQYCEFVAYYLEEHHHPYNDRKLVFEQAGHDVVSLSLPTLGDDAYSTGRFIEVDGGTPESNGRASEAAWAAILDFLKTMLGAPPR